MMVYGAKDWFKYRLPLGGWPKAYISWRPTAYEPLPSVSYGAKDWFKYWRWAATTTTTTNTTRVGPPWPP